MSQPFGRFTALIDKKLGKELPIEHIIFLCGATAGVLLSAFGTISNFVMKLHYISVIIPLFNFIVDITCIIYSLITKRWRGTALLVYFCASFVLFPFLWFTTGGTMSSSLPLIIGLGVVLAIVFDGKLRMFFYISTLLLYSGFIIFELYFPGNFIPYPDRESWYYDVLFGFVLSYLASGGLAYFTLVRYNNMKKQTEALVQQLETISKTDPLTGVFNRRQLMYQIDEEMRKAYDDNSELSLCIIDIDFFKKVNDTYGHLYGDEVLVKMAAAISGSLGEDEIFGRYGGEEFVILFPGGNLENSMRKIDACIKALAEIKWTHGGPITISGGMSVYTKGISYSKFLENADVNLYKAKNSGRNRIEF